VDRERCRNDQAAFSQSTRGEIVVRPCRHDNYHVGDRSRLKDVHSRSGDKSEGMRVLALPSDFLVENRQIHYRPIGSMSFAQQTKALPSISDYVRYLLVEVHPNVKGIIHTHTKRINAFLSDSLRDLGSRIVTYTDAKDRDQAVHTHTNSRNPTVLLTPGMTEGLDLKDDLSRFQIICKVPFPPLDDYNKARMNSDPAWYQWRTALTLVQATGRSVRSNTDYAATYVLDSDFERFVAKNKNSLPGWWLAAIRWPKKPVPIPKTPTPETTEYFF